MSSRSIRIDPFNPILKLMRSATELVSGKLHLTKESDQTYINFLNQTTIGSMWDCIKPIQMHAIDSEANVMDTLLFLQSHKISSVPLMTTQNELVGVIDILDLVAFVVAKFATRVFYAEETTIRQFDEFNNTKVKDIVNLSGRSKVRFISSKQNIFTLISELTVPDTRRVFVLDDSNTIVHIISQSQVVNFINENRKHKFHHVPLTLFQEPISKWLSETSKREVVVNISDSDLLLKAFESIITNRVSGVGIIDNEGKIVGCLSASDLKRLSFTNPEKSINFHPLFMPCSHLKEPFNQVYFVHPDDTLDTVCEIISEKKIHRLFVVENEKPTCVLSLSDVMFQFIKDIDNK